ncbi:MAG: DUF3127 domain-containing protein [Methylococcales bacterium]|nr:DUF3127 domain-containing protein [Methylococcales bacterium]MBT7408220.1 DUF3127 domain-containing protein [Methylococcales bacterium]
MEIKAKIIEIFNESQVSSKFKKREFVVEYAENPEYPEFLKMELVQSKCDIINDFNVGDEVDVSFNLKGRKWVNPKGETVYFNSIQAWKISHLSDNQSNQNSTMDQNSPPPPNEAPPWAENDDVPF